VNSKPDLAGNQNCPGKAPDQNNEKSRRLGKSLSNRWLSHLIIAKPEFKQFSD
jgi:hypothetical protein